MRTQRRYARLAPLAVLSFAACTTSPTLSRFPPANSPAGVRATLRVGTQRVQGELLEASDSGFVVLRSPEILFARLADVREASFHGLGRIPVRAIRPKEMDTLRHASRFPTGIPLGVLPQLLAHTGQRAVVVVTP